MNLENGTFKNDLFISYAHLDNLIHDGEKKGWVDRLHHALGIHLTQRLGEKAQIWKCEQLRSNDILDEEIVAQFPNTALLLSIITPRYAKSDWCRREVQEFCKAAERTGGLIKDRRARVFKVLKTPLAPDLQETLPDVIQSTLGINFSTVIDGQELELDEIMGEDLKHLFQRKVAMLADDITETIVALEKPSPSPTSTDFDESVEEGQVVYLAMTNSELEDKRKEIEFELKKSGYTVLPEQPLPHDEAGFRQEVQTLLASCDLAIHLIGASPGYIPESGNEGISIVQNQLAIEQSQKTQLPRVVWLPEKTSSANDNLYQSFIDAIRQDEAMQYGADLIEGGIEELKTSVHQILKKESGLDVDYDPSSKLIYVDCIKEDREEMTFLTLIQFLEKQGYVTLFPNFEGSPAEARKTDEEILKICDAIVLFYGAGNKNWLKSRKINLIKAAAIRPDISTLPKCTVLAGDHSDDKKKLASLEETDTVNCLEGFLDAHQPRLMKILELPVVQEHEH